MYPAKRRGCSFEPGGSSEEKIQLEESIQKLLAKGAIEECEPCKGQFLSPYFLVPKPNGSNRFILNVKGLNRFIEKSHFKMENFRTASKLIMKDCYMGSLDIEDAYFCVPIHRDYKKFLRFTLRGVIYQFNCLPFGISSAPMVFPKIMKPVMNTLRQRGHISCIYLDDILCIGNTYQACAENICDTISLLERLGFMVNYKKSVLQPSRGCKYLGFFLNSERFTIELTEKKKSRLRELVDEFLSMEECIIRDFAKCIGFLNSYCPAVAYSPVCKRLERERYLALILSGGNYAEKMTIPRYLEEDFKWWKEALVIGRNPIRSGNYKIEIFSDASLSGWGAYSNGISAYGFWNETEKKLHINYLELMAIFFSH